MKLEVNITKTRFFVILISLFIISGMIFVFAIGGTDPNVFGHSASEILPPTGCNTGQVLQWTGSSWTCANSGSSTSTPLHFKIFTRNDTFIVPDGVTSIIVEVYGAGGAGSSAGCSSSGGCPCPGGDGGNGGYGKGNFSVTTGQTYNVVIGKGGTVTESTNPTDGGNTSVGSLIYARGGFAGIAGQDAVHSCNDGSPGGDGGSNGIINVNGAGSNGGTNFVYSTGSQNQGSDGRVVIWW
jgi:hypothetical protein